MGVEYQLNISKIGQKCAFSNTYVSPLLLYDYSYVRDGLVVISMMGLLALCFYTFEHFGFVSCISTVSGVKNNTGCIGASLV